MDRNVQFEAEIRVGIKFSILESRSRNTRRSVVLKSIRSCPSAATFAKSKPVLHLPRRLKSDMVASMSGILATRRGQGSAFATRLICAMTAGSGPYLVTRREDGYGDVFPLQAGQRITLGRANTNRIVLKDELCSREHAEVYFAAGNWHLRDLKSLNGTRVGAEPLVGCRLGACARR